MNFAFKEHFKEFQTHFQHNCQKFLTDIFISLSEINSNDRIRLTQIVTHFLLISHGLRFISTHHFLKISSLLNLLWN